MDKILFGLIQGLDTPPSPEIRGKTSYFPSDVGRAMDDTFYKILKVSSSRAEIDTALSSMREGDTLSQAQVMKKPGAKDGEIKWEVLN